VTRISPETPSANANTNLVLLKASLNIKISGDQCLGWQDARPKLEVGQVSLIP